MHPNHVWAIDFVHDKLSNGRSYKMLAVLDEYRVACPSFKRMRKYPVNAYRPNSPYSK